jgi:hypothetical protein
MKTLWGSNIYIIYIQYYMYEYRSYPEGIWLKFNMGITVSFYKIPKAKKIRKLHLIKQTDLTKVCFKFTFFNLKNVCRFPACLLSAKKNQK